VATLGLGLGLQGRARFVRSLDANDYFSSMGEGKWIHKYHLNPEFFAFASLAFRLPNFSFKNFPLKTSPISK
jgi:hypothetical protein